MSLKRSSSILTFVVTFAFFATLFHSRIGVVLAECDCGTDKSCQGAGATCDPDNKCHVGSCQYIIDTCYRCNGTQCVSSTVRRPAKCPAPNNCDACQNQNPPPGGVAPTLPPTCSYPNLAIQVSADGTTWGSSADTIRSANGYTKRFYRIQSGGSNIIAANANAPITMKWEKTATTGGGAVRVVDTYATTSTETSLKHNAICSLVASGNYFMCETPVDKRAENIGDAGDYKYTVSSPGCTDTAGTYKISTATQATSCPTQGIRLEYSSDKVVWRQYGQYFTSNATGNQPQMCARVVDVASGAVLDRDNLEERWWTPAVTTPSDTNASSIGSANAVAGGWVPWKNNQSVYDNGCWTPTTRLAAGLWTGEARYYGLSACSSKAVQGIGTAPTCRENIPPIFKIFGDANGDCEVDLINDFVQFIREKMRVLTTKDADFNGSGAVDSSDFAIWKLGYQTFQRR